MSEVPNPLRSYRKLQKISLERMAELIAEKGLPKPSVAKLSRIESGVQPVPPDLVPVFEEIAGWPAVEQRPDLAKLFSSKGAAR